MSGKFRNLQLQYWERCAVTGCKEGHLLRASHIKPLVKIIPERARLPLQRVAACP